jgi:hypothetical protein
MVIYNNNYKLGIYTQGSFSSQAFKSRLLNVVFEYRRLYQSIRTLTGNMETLYIMGNRLIWSVNMLEHRGSSSAALGINSDITSIIMAKYA